MTVGEWLPTTIRDLSEAGVGSARLDCLILLEDELNKDRSSLLAHTELELPAEAVTALAYKVAQRMKHVPLAYIRGHVEFYGRNFLVNRHVLTPRPETEAMISLASSLPLPDKPTIMDIGTGSGAIAITVKLELPQATVFATDIDEQCLEVARKNAANLNAGVSFVKADLINGLSGGSWQSVVIDVLLTNLPYVPDAYEINRAAGHEPHLALFGGTDGLNLYRQLFAQLKQMGRQPGYVLTESLPAQHIQLAEIAALHDYHQQALEGYIQVFALSSGDTSKSNKS